MKSALFLALIGSLHAAELDPAQIPNSAKWQFHADLDAMRDSATGKILFALMEAEHGKQLRAFERMFSLHPLNDLRGITLYGDGQKDHAVALIHGSFDRDHIEDVVSAADDHVVDTHAGFTVHHWKDKDAEQHAAFANKNLLVFSRQEALLRDALDVLKAKAPAGKDPFFEALDRQPLIAASARLSEIDLPGDGARLIRMAKTLHLAAHEHEGRFILGMAAETKDAADADRLRRMIDGVIAFGQASDAKLDQLDFQAVMARAPSQPALSGKISLPVADLITLMGKAAAEQRKDGP